MLCSPCTICTDAASGALHKPGKLESRKLSHKKCKVKTAAVKSPIMNTDCDISWLRSKIFLGPKLYQWVTVISFFVKIFICHRMKLIHILSILNVPMKVLNMSLNISWNIKYSQDEN